MGADGPKRGPNRCPDIRRAIADSSAWGASVQATVAISCYWLWLYIAYSLDIFVVSSDAFVYFDILQKGFSFLGAALFMTVVARLPQSEFLERTAFLEIFPLAAGMPIVVLAVTTRAGLVAPTGLVLAIWTCMGAGTAAAFLRLFTGLRGTERRRFCTVNSLALFLSGLFYVLLLGLQDGLQIVLTAFVICCVSLVPMPARHENGDAADAGGQTASEHAFSAAAVAAVLSFRGELFLLSIVFGFSYCLSIFFSIASGNLEFVWLSLCMPGIFLMLYNIFLKNKTSIRMLMTLLFPITALLLLLLPFGDQFGFILYCSLLVMCFTTYDVLNVVRLNDIISVNRLPQAKSWSMARYPQLAGCVLGWAVGYMTLLAQDALAFALPAVCIVLVVAIVVMLTRYVWKSASAQGTAHVSEETVERVYDAIVLQCALSPREREVMMLLVRGYSTERIGKDLGISYHTVKTHVYHIYQKVGVHSQQELIDFVEERIRLVES